MAYNNAMVSRIIHDVEPKETPETPELQQRVVELAQRKLTIALPGLESSLKDTAAETMEQLAPYLVKKSQPGFVDDVVHSVEWYMGGILSEQFDKLEAKTDEQQALKVMGQAIRSVIDSVHEITGVKTSVPHSGKVADLLERHRREAEFCTPVTGRSV